MMEFPATRQSALQKYPLRVVEKFLQEVLWRGYWKGWLERRPRVWDGHGASDTAVDPEVAAARREVATGRSPSGIMNHFARELLEIGYLHNHARMWWASYWIHHCRLPWELGARHFSVICSMRTRPAIR
jgi:deoxyribodipyrimidine photo-lyase